MNENETSLTGIDPAYAAALEGDRQAQTNEPTTDGADSPADAAAAPAVQGEVADQANAERAMLELQVQNPPAPASDTPSPSELAAVVAMDEHETVAGVNLDQVFQRIDQVQNLSELPIDAEVDEWPECLLKCFKGTDRRTMRLVRLGDQYFQQEISHE